MRQRKEHLNGGRQTPQSYLIDTASDHMLYLYIVVVLRMVAVQVEDLKWATYLTWIGPMPQRGEGDSPPKYGWWGQMLLRRTLSAAHS